MGGAVDRVERDVEDREADRARRRRGPASRPRLAHHGPTRASSSLSQARQDSRIRCGADHAGECTKRRSGGGLRGDRSTAGPTIGKTTAPTAAARRDRSLQCRCLSLPASRCRFTPRSSRPTTFAASSTARIDERFAEHLGRAFGSEAIAAGERAVAVGRDGRLSGPALAAALIRGLASTGLDVVDLGAVTTPMLYYVAATRGGTVARAACRSPAATTRRTTTASRWCWPAAPSTATTSSACAGASRPSDYASGSAAASRRWTSRPSTRRASPATASWRDR